jgi:hypothetical protein
MKISQLFEMSNLRKSETGLPMNIYVSSGGSVNTQHGPRIKVMVSTSDKMDPYDTVSVMLKKDITPADVIGYKRLPESVIGVLRTYININYDTLIKYWNDELSTTEMIAQLKKVS